MTSRLAAVLTGLVLILASACPAARADELPRGVPSAYRLLYSQDFARPGAVDDFLMTDPKAWKLTPAAGDEPAALELTKASKYSPPFRSPVNIALVKGHVFGDCVIEAKCMQTGKEYGHRDMIFVFGYQSPSKYYYTHIATKADDHANQVFLVNDAPRVKISERSNAGNQWGLNVWRTVRIERTLADGAIKVYFDDLTEPIMVAHDKTFAAGWIGFGSFDDTGKIANIQVWGDQTEAKPAPPFKP